MEHKALSCRNNCRRYQAVNYSWMRRGETIKMTPTPSQSALIRQSPDPSQPPTRGPRTSIAVRYCYIYIYMRAISTSPGVSNKSDEGFPAEVILFISPPKQYPPSRPLRQYIHRLLVDSCTANMIDTLLSAMERLGSIVFPFRSAVPVNQQSKNVSTSIPVTSIHAGRIPSSERSFC